MKYRLTQAALDDIVAITSPIRVAQKSPQKAKLVVRRLKIAFERLAETPSLGHVREESQDGEARALPVTGVLVI